jgi:hypothetical protein
MIQVIYRRAVLPAQAGRAAPPDDTGDLQVASLDERRPQRLKEQVILQVGAYRENP